MKRKAVWFGVPWLLGMILAEFCRTNAMLPILPASILLLGVFFLYKVIDWKQLVTILTALLLGFTWFSGYGYFQEQPIRTETGFSNSFTGMVVSTKVYDNDRAAYQVKGKFQDGTRGKVSVYTMDYGAEYGDEMVICGNFSEIEDSWLYETKSTNRANGIVVQADTDAETFVTHREGYAVIRGIEAYRNRIALRICVFAGTDAGGMVSAMLLGDRSHLEDDTKDALGQNGILHVLSVSGLHLVMILSVWLWLAKRIGISRIPSFLVTVGIVCGYAFLVEFPISILRAGLMFLIAQAAPLFFRKNDTANSLSLGIIALTLWNPAIAVSASFLLSVGGTFGVGVAAPWLVQMIHGNRWYHRIGKTVLSMCCVSVCTFPIMILFFRRVSLAAPIANIILVPICSLILLLALPIFLTGGADFPGRILCGIIRILYRILMGLSEQISRFFPWSYPTGWKVLPLLTGVLLLFVVVIRIYKNRQKDVAIATCIALVLLFTGRMVYAIGESNGLRVAVLGTTEQMAVVIQYQGKTDVIDLTGHHKNATYVSAYFQEQGISTADSLILTTKIPQMCALYENTLGKIEETASDVETCLPIAYSEQLQIVNGSESMQVVENTLLIDYAGQQLQITPTLENYTADGIAVCENIGENVQDSGRIYQKDECLVIQIRPNGTVTVSEE